MLAVVLGPPKANPPGAGAGVVGVAAPNVGVAALPPPKENDDEACAGAAAEVGAPKPTPAENADAEAAPVLDPNANPAAAGVVPVEEGMDPKDELVAAPAAEGIAPNPTWRTSEHQPQILFQSLCQTMAVY